MEYINVVSHDPHITIVQLNRPKVYNALSRPLLLELGNALDTIADCEKTRAVVVTGNEGVFCTGADLKERVTFTEEDVRAFIPLIRDTITKVEELPQPVIAAMEGYAFGGGVELALACDIRVAGDQTQFGLLETSLGIIPGAGGTQRLPRIVGEAKAKELIFLANKISAKEAKEYGLVNHIVGSGESLDSALHIAKRISGNAPLAIRQAKRAIHASSSVSLKEGLKQETKAYEPLIATTDRLEGLKAFKEKRTPAYLGV